MTHPLLVGLTLVRDLLGAPVPTLPTNRQAASLVATVRAHLLDGAALSVYRYGLALAEGPTTRLRHIWSLLRPTPAESALGLIYPVTYLARPSASP